VSRLPGARHRNLAASSILREGDMGAMERAATALEDGAHGLIVVDYSHQLGIVNGIGWSYGANGTYRQASSGADELLIRLGRWQGEVIVLVEVWVYQSAASEALPVKVYLERVDATTGEAETIASDEEPTAEDTYVRKVLRLVDARAGRPRGYVCAAGERTRLQIKASSAGDRVSGVAVHLAHPRTS
jgi:hypothetical protein